MKFTVASPCSESWEAMSGDDRERFCRRCNLTVHNFAAMSDDEVESFMANASGRVCGRFFQRSDGTVLTRDCPVGWRQKIVRRVTVVAVLLVGVFTTFLAYGQDSGPTPQYPAWVQNVMEWLASTPPPPPVINMGVMICPPAPPPTPPPPSLFNW